MSKRDWHFIILAFLIWRFGLFVVLLFAVKFVPLAHNFLGGGLGNYLSNPYFWGWANFDGEHYLSIAQNGYGFGEYAFFPLFPVLIRGVGTLFGGSLFSFSLAGNIIVNSSFFLALVGFFKLVHLNYSEKVAKKATILLLLFPTSFYFAAIYTESLFLMLAIWSFYFARRENWILTAVFGILLTGTRFVGLIILPAILVEWFVQSKRNDFIRKFPWVALTIPAGLLGYMYYLDRVVHDKFAFYTNLASFGEQRSSHLVTLPQVFYRYIFKILPSLNTTFFPTLFTTYFEFFISLIFLLLIVFAFRKLKIGYWIFLTLGYLIPTFSGSFSSLPRYVLVLFPVYILLARLLEKKKIFLFVFGAVSLVLLLISFTLFIRGYWLS